MMKVKLGIVSIGLLLVFSIAVMASGWALSTYSVRVVGNYPMISWSMQEQHGVGGFAIERSMGNDDSFIEIATIHNLKPTHETYRYYDDSVLKTTATRYYYRIRVLDRNNESLGYTDSRSVEVDNNLVQQTWGSLKALFR